MAQAYRNWKEQLVNVKEANQMKRWVNWPHFLSRTDPGGADDASEPVVHLHYKDRSSPDEIEHFRIGKGSSFFLNFLAGGMIDLNLEQVREIKFENIEHGRKHDLLDAPNYHVSVSLTNGRVLEGYTDSLYSFSGIRQGTDWSFSCRGGSPENLEAQNNLYRIVVRRSPKQ